MLVKELKSILDTLDDFDEVMVCNHHLESKPIVKAKVRIRKVSGLKQGKIVLDLHEERT